jgi:hypothetical protein
MIKTITSKCPICNRSNPFNTPSEINNVKEINVPWFQCSFCFKNSKKDYWT